MSPREAIKGAAAVVGALWSSIDPMLAALLVLIFFDVATGLLAAYVNKEISSDATFRGGAKKAIALLVALSGEWMTGFLNLGVDLGAALAAYYCVHESISILENAARAGVPLPDGLLNALQKTVKKQ